MRPREDVGESLRFAPAGFLFHLNVIGNIAHLHLHSAFALLVHTYSNRQGSHSSGDDSDYSISAFSNASGVSE